MNNISSQHQQFLKSVDALELINKIKKFRQLNFKDIDCQDIKKEMLLALGKKNEFSYIHILKKLAKGTKFFRVRELGERVDNTINFWTISDFWNPPVEFVNKYGRLNKPRESLLYTTPCNFRVAIKEAKLKQNIYYALIVYEAKEDIKVNIIGGEYNYEELGILDKKLIVINEIYNNFLREEFTRDVGVGTEYLYKISEIIAKYYFDLPPRDIQDAWVYPSVYDRGFYNVCFRPDIAKEILALKGAMIAKNDVVNELKVGCIAHGFDENGITKIHELGSEVQQKIFPDIKARIT